MPPLAEMKQSVKMKISKEKYDVIQNIAFLVGSFVFVAGSAVAVASSLQAVRNKQMEAKSR